MQYLLIVTLIVVLILNIVILVKLSKGAGSEEDTQQAVSDLHDEVEDVRDSLNQLSGVINYTNKNSSEGFTRFENGVSRTLYEFREDQRKSAENTSRVQTQALNKMSEDQRESLKAFREEMHRISVTNNEGLSNLQTKTAESLAKSAQEQNKTLVDMLTRLQTSNEKKLDEIRGVVNEKLDKTLNERLDSSFKQVGDSLVKLHESLGQLQSLSTGVESLNKTLTNVKTRGTWGEVQLARILEQTLTTGQYVENVATKKRSSDRVEFAICLPGNEEGSESVYLPIDSKFPSDIYNKIVEASENADADALKRAKNELKVRIQHEARNIRDKYLDPPATTSYAILFLPTEGLYAEVLQIDGLSEECQKIGIMIAGPTTITALLNTIAVGFRNVALNRKSAEVRKLLEAVKAQVDKLDETVEKAQKKIDDAAKATSDISKRTGIMRSRMKKVGAIDADESDKLLGISDASEFDLIDDEDGED